MFHRQLFTGDELHSGDVSSRLAKDIEQVTKVSTDVLPEMLITGIKLCGAFLLMRWFDERLAWALLLLTPLAIVFGKLIARRLRHMTLDIRQDESRIQMQVQEGNSIHDVAKIKPRKFPAVEIRCKFIGNFRSNQKLGMTIEATAQP